MRFILLQLNVHNLQRNWQFQPLLNSRMLKLVRSLSCTKGSVRWCSLKALLSILCGSLIADLKHGRHPKDYDGYRIYSNAQRSRRQHYLLASLSIRVEGNRQRLMEHDNCSIHYKTSHPEQHRCLFASLLICLRDDRGHPMEYEACGIPIRAHHPARQHCLLCIT